MIKNPFIRGFLVCLALVGVLFIGYHAIGVRKVATVNREVIVQLSQRVVALEAALKSAK